MARPDKHRNGRLQIPLPFEDAIRAALETRWRPDAGEPRPDEGKKRQKKKPRGRRKTA